MMLNRLPKWCIWLSILAVLPSLAKADALSEGRALYQQKNYTAAAQKFLQATQENPNNAKAWWHLGFADRKLGRYPDALKAFQKAGRIDPTDSFASSPAKYQQILSQTQADINRGSTGNHGGTGGYHRSSSKEQNIVTALQTSDVYLSPGFKADAGRLQSTADSLRPLAVKFVVLNSEIHGRSLMQAARRLHHYLSLGKGILILASHRGVAAYAQGISISTLGRETRKVAPIMEGGDYTTGLAQLAQNLAADEKAGATRSTIAWGTVFGIVAIIIVLAILFSAVSRRRTALARREKLSKQREQVVNQFNFISNQLETTEGPQVAIARQSRAAAGTKLDEASQLLVKASSEYDFQRVQTLLDQAEADLISARRALGGDSAPTAGVATGATAPASNATTDWDKVPTEQRGVCFFCSKPALLNELTPVNVNLGGEERKVLACADDLNTVKSGQMPNIRAFNVNGQMVPWYANNQYNPYNNYYSSGFDSGSFLGDMVSMYMINQMFWGWNQPGWGWGNNYAFYPEHSFYQDYSSGVAGGFADFGSPADTAGETDFFQGASGDTGAGVADFGSSQS